MVRRFLDDRSNSLRDSTKKADSDGVIRKWIPSVVTKSFADDYRDRDPRGSPKFNDIRGTATFRAGKPFDDSKYRSGFDATYFSYELPDTTLLYQSCRYDHIGMMKKKGFLVRRPVNLERFDRQMNIGDCVFGTGPRRVIYNWPAVMKAGPGSTVFVTEGEKNAKDLIKRGLLATTVICHDWTEECVAALTGYDLIILEDHDENGRKMAAAAQKLLARVVKSTRIVPCVHLWNHLAPEWAAKGPPEHGDVSDFFSFYGDASKLIDICREIPVAGTFVAEVHGFPAEETIPIWNFLYGKHILRGTVAITAGRGETGKSTKSVADALAMTTENNLIGIIPNGVFRVLLINLEDDRATVDKRIQAAMKHHDLKPEDVGNRLFTIAKGEMKLKLAAQTRIGVITRDEDAIRGIIAFIKDKKIDVVSIDPLRKFHRVNENDNVAMGEVIEIFEEIAEGANCAIHIWHHARKGNGEESTIEATRGAGAITDAARSAEITDKMTKDEAKKLGIPEKKRRFYFKTYNGKINFAPPAEKMDWFEIKNVDLNNGFPVHDSVGVVTRWVPPAVQSQEISSVVIGQIKERVGIEPRWRDDSRADMWVGKAIAAVLGLDANDETDRVAVKTVYSGLIRSGILKVVETMEPRQRRPKTFLVAND
jgi:hypothetical protein